MVSEKVIMVMVTVAILVAIAVIGAIALGYVPGLSSPLLEQAGEGLKELLGVG